MVVCLDNGISGIHGNPEVKFGGDSRSSSASDAKCGRDRSSIRRTCVRQPPGSIRHHLHHSGAVAVRSDLPLARIADKAEAPLVALHLLIPIKKSPC